MTVVAQQEHRGVVVRRTGRVPHHILAQRGQHAARVRVFQQVGPVGQRMERASLLTRLGDAVGVQQ